MKHYEYEISLLVEDELSPGKKEELLSHLSVCKKCSKTFRDYTNVKNNVFRFYDTLPGNTELRHSVNNRKISSVRFRKPEIFIPFSIAASIILVLLILIKYGVHLQKISQVAQVNTSSALSKTIKMESNSSVGNKIESISIRKKKKAGLNNNYNILDFNKAINKALSLQKNEPVSTQLWQVGRVVDQEEFNKAINAALYNCYKD
jgi:hypothetical protein